MTYTAQAGDSIRSIAIRVLGSSAQESTLLQVNRPRVAGSVLDLLPPGTKVLIPDQMVQAAKSAGAKVSDPNQVTIEVNGLRYAGWESVTLSRSIESAAAGFTVSMLDRWLATSEPWPIFRGDHVRIYIGNDLVLDGYVDSGSASLDANFRSLTINGRSRTADLVDCSSTVRPGIIKGKKLEQIATQIAAPYGVQVVAEVDTGGTIDVFAILPGETSHEALVRAAIARNLIVTDDEQGRLVITRSGSRRTRDRIEEGANLLAGDSQWSDVERFSEYIVEGQGAGQGQSALRASYRDPGVTRYRPRIIHAAAKSTIATLGARAEWEARSAAAKSSDATVTVQGWRQSSGELWRINRIVEVVAPSLSLSGDLLIAEVTYSLGEEGTLTGMRLTRPDAYLSEAALLAAKDAVKSRRVIEGKKR